VQVSELAVSVNLFKEKYLSHPGDLANATSFWPSTTEPERVFNGNGDGTVEAWRASNGCTAENYHEWNSVFDHLAAAKLVNMPQYDRNDVSSNRAGIAYPKCKGNPKGNAWAGNGGALSGFNDCGIRFAYEHDGHYIRIGMNAFDAWAPYAYYSFSAGFNPEEAVVYDLKFDDGKPLSGFIRAASISAYQCPVPGVDGSIAEFNGSYPPSCVDVANNQYKNLNNNTRICSLRVKTGS
jgi:hypothetical protein